MKARNYPGKSNHLAIPCKGTLDHCRETHHIKEDWKILAIVRLEDGTGFPLSLPSERGTIKGLHMQSDSSGRVGGN